MDIRSRYDPEEDVPAKQQFVRQKLTVAAKWSPNNAVFNTFKHPQKNAASCMSDAWFISQTFLYHGTIFFVA